MIAFLMSRRTRRYPHPFRKPQPMPGREGLVSALLVLVLSCASCAAQPPPANFQKAGENALQWVEQLVSLGPRPAGSPAQQKQQQVIVGELRSLDLEVAEQDFIAQTPKGEVPMKNIIAKLPGEGTRVVVVSGHYDTFHRPGLHFVGANDGGSSAAFLLALARVLAARPFKDSVWLVFFDGEESFVSWRDNDHTYGSRRLAAKWSSDGTAGRIKALLNVDMIGDENLQLIPEQHSTAWLRELVVSTAGKLGYGSIFALQRPSYIEDDHVPFLRAGIHAADLIDFDYGPSNSYWHTEEDTVDKLSAASLGTMLHIITETLRELEGVP